MVDSDRGHHMRADSHAGRKTWIAPRVIVSQLNATESHLSTGADVTTASFHLVTHGS
jgi:hypothetical protein